MKRLFQILAVTLLSATSSELCAGHNWAMAFAEKEQDIPTVVEYHSAQETAENGIVYNRIFDTFNELPTPASGKYVVHIDDNEYTTGIRSVGTTLQPTRCVYDLQGRRLLSQPAKGVYIRDGQKVYAQ